MKLVEVARAHQASIKHQGWAYESHIVSWRHARVDVLAANEGPLEKHETPHQTRAFMRKSPYARYHLFRNPFGELARHERAELAVIDLQDCLDWLVKPVLDGTPISDDAIAHRCPTHRRMLQIIGPCGHGKSTHLLAIENALAKLQPVQYVYFPEDGAQPPLPHVRPLLVDEAQRMNRTRLRTLLRGDGPLALGTHCDMELRFRRAGFAVKTINLDQPITPQRLQSMLNARVLASRMQPSVTIARRHSANCAGSGRTISCVDFHPLCLTLEQVVALQQRFGSNIRLIEHHLYEAFQLFAEKGEPWLPVN